jgi:hypothetical protein
MLFSIGALLLEIFTWTKILKEQKVLDVKDFMAGYYVQFFTGFGFFFGITFVTTSLGIFMVLYSQIFNPNLDSGTIGMVGRHLSRCCTWCS